MTTLIKAYSCVSSEVVEPKQRRSSYTFCTACNRNFAGVNAFDTHRVGKFGMDRRCLSPEEMEEKGFTMGVEPIRRWHEGESYTAMMETWHEPVSAKQLAGLQRMKGVS